MRNLARLCAVAVLALTGVAGAQDTVDPPNAAAAADPSQPALPSGVSESKQHQTPMSALAGTAWRLVKINSMDDQVEAPDDTSKYTLAFGADGRAAILADCNRGTGSWTSASAGQLRFGPIAATKALCPPGSLSEKYLAQFQWVRSYTLEDEHLFLATMADGSIIEFEPMEPPLAATVLGEEVRTSDPEEARQIVLTRLFGRYAEEQGIRVTGAEIDAYVESLRSGEHAKSLTDEDTLTPEEAAEVARMRRDMARAMIRQWKLNRALYRQFGGRIIYQQLGPEPLDAYRRYLEERQAAGDFMFYTKPFKEKFWRYFTDETMHDFYPPGSAEEARAFAAPPWTANDHGASRAKADDEKSPRP